MVKDSGHAAQDAAPWNLQSRMGVHLCGRSLQFGPDEESLISGSLRLGPGRSVSGRLQNGDADKLSPRKPREKLVYKDQIAATGIFFSSLLGARTANVQ